MIIVYYPLCMILNKKYIILLVLIIKYMLMINYKIKYKKFMKVIKIV